MSEKLTDEELAERVALAHHMGYEAGRDSCKARITELRRALRNLRDEYAVMYKHLEIEFEHSLPFEQRAVVQAAAHNLEGDD